MLGRDENLHFVFFPIILRFLDFFSTVTNRVDQFDAEFDAANEKILEKAESDLNWLKERIFYFKK